MAPETRRPVVGVDALAVWCRRWLGAPPAAPLFEAGFACPEPLVDLQPLVGLAATAEALVPDAGQPPPDGELTAVSAAVLARLVELAPDPGSVPSLAPSP